MDNKNVELSLKWSIVKWIFWLAIPILIGNFLQSAYQFVDAYWIGKLSKEAVAAVASSGSIVFLILSLGMGFSMAGTILIAQYVGAKNKKMVNKGAAQTLLSVVIISAFLSVLGYFSAQHILLLMWAADEIIEPATQFMQITFMGLMFNFIFSMFQSVMRGVWEVKLPLYVIGGTILLNFVMDPVLIFGWGVIPAMGVRGAALATLITQAISSLIGLIILFRGKYGIKIQRKDFKPDFWFIKKAFVLGIPSSVEMAIRSLGYVFLMKLVMSFWVIANAAYGAGANVFQLLFIPTLGLSMATSTMVAQNIGARQLDRAQQIAYKSSLIAFLILESAGVLVFIFAPELIGIFIDAQKEPEVIKIWTDLLRFSAFTMWFMGIQFTLTGIFRASGKTTLAMILWIISMFVVEIPLAYLLAYYTSLKVDGVWLAFALVNLIMALICYLIYRKWDWKNTKLTQQDIEQEEAMEATLIWENKN